MRCAASARTLRRRPRAVGVPPRAGGAGGVALGDTPRESRFIRLVMGLAAAGELAAANPPAASAPGPPSSITISMSATYLPSARKKEKERVEEKKKNEERKKERKKSATERDVRHLAAVLCERNHRGELRVAVRLLKRLGPVLRYAEEEGAEEEEEERGRSMGGAHVSTARTDARSRLQKRAQWPRTRSMEHHKRCIAPGKGPTCVTRTMLSVDRKDARRLVSSKMLGGASQTVSKIRVKCNGT